MKPLQRKVTEPQWSEALIHAGEPFLEWKIQPLVKTQQFGRATDKAAVYAFILSKYLKKKRRS